MSDNQKQKKVLLVEDDPFISGMYQTKLKLEGYDVDTVVDGEAALQKMEEQEYAIVLLDIMMPKLNGFEVLKEIRTGAKKSISDTPVIMLTNLGQKSDIEQGLLLGANDYIVKANFTPSEVVEKIKKLIQ
jgi:DNA-binding response OmpR family regulator